MAGPPGAYAITGLVLLTLPSEAGKAAAQLSLPLTGHSDEEVRGGDRPPILWGMSLLYKILLEKATLRTAPRRHRSV